MAARICVAQIGAAHGTRGEVRLWSFTADPAAVKDYGPLESEDGKAHFEIEALCPGCVVVEDDSLFLILLAIQLLTSSAAGRVFALRAHAL